MIDEIDSSLNTKKWYRSKTININLALLGVILLSKYVGIELSSDEVVVIETTANIFLRIISKMGLAF